VEYNLLIVVLFVACCAARERIPITSALGNSSNWVKSKDFIVGGTPVSSAADYPFTAAYLDGNFQFCGAMIISDRFALTAAHCIGAAFPSNEWIAVGSLRHDGAGSPGAQYYAVEQTMTHPNWDSSTMSFDGALLRLATPIQFSDYVRPIRMAPSNSGPFTGQQSTCTGWGTTSEGGSPSMVLREVTLPVITNAECSQSYDGITGSMICAYETGGGKDSCQGDSGGPLFVYSNGDPLAVGIVSWGIGCARNGYPGVYGRVSQINAWVCDVTDVC